MRSSVFKTLFSLTSALALFLIPGSLFADTIFVSPLTATYSVGETFTVRVMVSSSAQAINALSGTLNFPIDKLQVVSVSKIGSILSLWVQEPFFSNSRGTVTFEGVVPNPGFRESNGRVLAINFKVVGTGQADVRLSTGSLLANDGYGTNVLKTLGSASYALIEREVLPVTPPAITETSDDSGGEAEEPVILDLGKLETKKAPEEKFTFVLPDLRLVGEWLIRILSILIPLLALFFFLIHTTKRGVNNIKVLRRKLRKDLHGIDLEVRESFDALKDDALKSVHMLERARIKRPLTVEEATIVRALRENLIQGERAIHKRVQQAEQDLDE